jgi:hypothetical protein
MTHGDYCAFSTDGVEAFLCAALCSCRRKATRDRNLICLRHARRPFRFFDACAGSACHWKSLYSLACHARRWMLSRGSACWLAFGPITSTASAPGFTRAPSLWLYAVRRSSSFSMLFGDRFDVGRTQTLIQVNELSFSMTTTAAAAKINFFSRQFVYNWPAVKISNN